MNKPPLPPLAVLYGRVSADLQTTSSQEARCKEYLQYKRRSFAEEFHEEGVSGSVAIWIWDRPNGGKLRDRLKQGDIEHLDGKLERDELCSSEPFGFTAAPTGGVAPKGKAPRQADLRVRSGGTRRQLVRGTRCAGMAIFQGATKRKMGRVSLRCESGFWRGLESQKGNEWGFVACGTFWRYLVSVLNGSWPRYATICGW